MNAVDLHAFVIKKLNLDTGIRAPRALEPLSTPVAALPDDALTQRACRGDRAAVDALYRRHAAALRVTARAMLEKEHHAADDVVGEVFAALVSGRAGTFDSARGNALTWLRGVVRRTADAYLVARDAELPAGCAEYIDDRGAEADEIACDRRGDDGKKGRAR